MCCEKNKHTIKKRKQSYIEKSLFYTWETSEDLCSQGSESESLWSVSWSISLELIVPETPPKRENTIYLSYIIIKTNIVWYLIKFTK